MVVPALKEILVEDFMQKDHSTLAAEFKAGKLIITNPGPGIPKSFSGEDLVSRLNLLAENGWQINALSVAASTFTISLERIDVTPPEIPQYSLLMFQTTQQQSERPPINYEKQSFLESVQVWVNQGWRELKTVSFLSSHQGQWMVSLLVKDWAQSKHPYWRDE